MSDTYRWTLDEYLMRCEDGRDLEEIVTEGDLDRDLFADAVKRWNLAHVNVIDADYLYVTIEELQALALGDGVRARLLAVAIRLEQRATEMTIGAKVAVVVDRDYDPPTCKSRFLFVTDGHSMENYALNTQAFDRFVTVGLGRGDRPVGKCAAASNAIHLSSGGKVLRRVLVPAVQLAAIRLALSGLDPPLSVFDRWTRYLKSDPAGNLTLETGLLVERVLQRSGQGKEKVVVELQCQRAEVEVGESPFLLVRGHDFVTILYQLLRSTWGRRIAGPAVKAWSEERLGRILLVGLPPHTLDATKLFSSVRAQF
jgi:hypothetical protein